LDLIPKTANKESRRHFLKKTTLGLLTAPLLMGLTNSFAQRNKQRNIIFILSDDHRYDALSCLNHPIVKTPHMDRLLTNGIHFKNAFVTHSLCSPSRASILTGLYSHRHNVLDNRTELDPKIPTFPQLLQRAGHTTGFIGKWHMGGSNDVPRPGFDHWVSFKGQGKYFDNVYNINGEHKETKGYVTDVITDFSIDFLRKNNTGPFCLYLSHKAVHEDFDSAPRHAGKFDHITPPLPETFHNTEQNYADKPKWVRKQRDSCHGVDGLSYTHHTGIAGLYRRYAECLLGLDDSIGALTAFLEKENLLHDTLIIYMGDNGFQFGEHGLIDKRVMYEESIRVPLFAFCPALTRAGHVVEEMILNIDIAPTILEAAGLAVPSSMYGQSFYPAITGEPLDNWRRDFLYQYFWEAAYPMTPTIRGLRTEKYSYIKSYGTWDINELYDIENDPRQTKNLLEQIPLNRTGGPPERFRDNHIKDPELKQLVKDLDRRILYLLEETGGNVKPDWGKL